MTGDFSKADAGRMLEDAMGELQQQRKKLEELSEARKAQNVIRAKDNSFTMTFDGDGELVDMEFRGERYRTVAPAKLASAIVETIQRGRAENTARMNEIMGNPYDELGGVEGADPADILNEVMKPMMQSFEAFGVANLVSEVTGRDSSANGDKNGANEKGGKENG